MRAPRAEVGVATSIVIMMDAASERRPHRCIDHELPKLVDVLSMMCGLNRHAERASIPTPEDTPMDGCGNPAPAADARQISFNIMSADHLNDRNMEPE